MQESESQHATQGKGQLRHGRPVTGPGQRQKKQERIQPLSLALRSEQGLQAGIGRRGQDGVMAFDGGPVCADRPGRIGLRFKQQP